MMDGFCVYNIDAPGQESGATEYVCSVVIQFRKDLTRAVEWQLVMRTRS